MLVCNNCGNENPDGLTICMNCAATLAQMCPSCGSVISPGNIFCGQCGTRLVIDSQLGLAPISQPTSLLAKQEKMLLELREMMPSSLKTKIALAAPHLVGQRREITVLVARIVDYEAISRSMDNEDLYLASEALLQHLVEVVYKYEGTVDALSNKGLMAIFGLPVKHENDPERAVRASLEMHALLNKRAIPPAQQVLNIQIGIHTGQVIAGNLGEFHHMNYTIVGDTVNLANRLAEAAGRCETLTSFQTCQRTKPIFDYRVIPTTHHQNIQGTVQAYLPTRIRSKPGQVRGLPGLQVPMVGRDHDMQRLIETINRVRDTQESAIILLNGDAGLGKSRLIAEFRNFLEDQSVRIYQGTCSAHMRVTPYRVVSNIIQNAIGISEVENEDVQRKALREYLNQNLLDSSEIYPYLLHVLNLPQDDPIIETRIRLLSPSMLQHQIHSAIRLFLVAETNPTTKALIFDDLHWVDPASVDFLTYFVTAIDHSRIMLVLIARDFGEQPALQGLLRVQKTASVHSVIVDLKPLSIEENRLLVDELLPESMEGADTLKDLIVQRSAGNPYYAEELVRLLLDYDGIFRSGYTYQLTKEAQARLRDVPGTLQDLILTRFDRLPEDLRGLLLKASILGYSFNIRLLRCLVDTNDEDLEEKIYDLEERDYLIDADVETSGGYAFKHPLIQDSIYNTLLKIDLNRLHLMAAQAIDEDRQMLLGERNEQLAHHYSRSSIPEKAIPHLLAAAENALQRFANDVAVTHFENLLALVGEQIKLSPDQHGRVKIGLGKALKLTGGFGEAKRFLREGADVLQREGDYLLDLGQRRVLIDGYSELADLRAREGALDDAMQILQQGLALLGESGYEKYPTQWRRLADRIAWVYFRQGNLEEAFRQADLALLDVNLWEEDDPITLASLNNTLGGIYYMRSKQSEAVQFVERGLEIYKNLNYYWGMAIAYTNIGVLHFTLENWNQAVDNFERADAIRKQYGYTPERPTNLKNLGEVLICMGDFPRARETLESSKEISHRLGMHLAEAYAEIGLCRLATVESDIARAQAHLESARALLGSPADETGERAVQLLCLEAMIVAARGEYSNAMDFAERANKIAREGGYSAEQVDSLRISGMILSRLGKSLQAEANLKASIELAKKQRDRYRQAQAYFELGQLYITQGQQSGGRLDYLIKAREAYHQAIQYFEVLGAVYDLKKTQVASNLLQLEENATVAQARAEGLAAGPVGEWYQVAILQLKFVPQPGEDEELLYETYSLVLPALNDLIEANDGTVTRQQDGLTILFGAPTVREDDPERAVETAMQILNFFQEFTSQIQAPMTIKMGAAMGRVVGGKLGIAGEASFMVSGEPIQQVELLASIAPSNQVWVTQTVRNASGHRFDYRPVSTDLTTLLPGEECYQLVGLREQIRPVRGLMGIKTPFIGRSSELERMLSLGRNIENGKGGLVWIEGEAGIGKSRLMREFSSLMAAQGVFTWNGGCTARQTERAFSLFVDMMFQAFELQPTFSPEQIYRAIDQKLETWPIEIDAARPFMQWLLGVKPRGVPGERILSLEPEQLRRQIFIHFRKLFSTMAAHKPVLLFLDDLQWIDSISADLLMFLSHMITTHPLLVVGTLRSNENLNPESVLLQLMGMYPSQTVQLRIQPFTTLESQELLNKLFSRAKMPEATLALIVQQSGGNPYYLEEFVRMLLEQDFLRLKRGRLEVDQDFELDMLSVPSSLEALIRARIDSLPNQAKKLIQSGSVIGQRFNMDMLEIVSQMNRIEPVMEMLRARGMLTSTGERGYWQFNHPLIEMTVYNTILRSQQRILHSRTAAALEIEWRGSQAEHSEELAYHYLKAGESDQAVFYLILAGERAAARYANEEALKLFEQANELVAELSDPKDEYRWRIAVGLGSVYLLIANYEASVDALQMVLGMLKSPALSISQRAGLYRLLGEAMQKKGDQDRAMGYFRTALDILSVPADRQDQAEAVRVYARQGWSHFLRGDFKEANESCQSALKWARRAENPISMAAVENLLGGIAYRQGDLRQALLHTHQAMNYWAQIGYTWGVATSYGNLGILEVMAGNWAEAQRFMQKSLELYQETGDVEAIARAHNNLASLARDRGELELAENHFRYSLAVAKPFKIAFHTANSLMSLAQTLLMKGELEAAQAALQEGFAIGEEIEARDMLAELRRTQADIYLAYGDLEQASQTALSAAQQAVETQNRVVEASAWRILSECLRQRNDLQQASDRLQKAWEALTDSADELEKGRVHAQAARIELALGNKLQASQHYEKAHEIFSSLGAKHDLAQLDLTIL